MDYEKVEKAGEGFHERRSPFQILQDRVEAFEKIVGPLLTEFKIVQGVVDACLMSDEK